MEDTLHQQAVQQQQLSTCSALQEDDIVLITDLASNSSRGIHPALGRIVGFLDPDRKSQAIVKFSNGKIARPVSRIVRVVKANEQIGHRGKCICPYAEADEQVQDDHEEQEEDLPAPDDIDMAANHQDEDTQDGLPGTADVFVLVEDDGVQQYLPVQPSPLPEEPLHQAVEGIHEDLEEGFPPPPEGLVARAARGPRQVPTRREQETASHLSETGPGQDIKRAD